MGPLVLSSTNRHRISAIALHSGHCQLHGSAPVRTHVRSCSYEGSPDRPRDREHKATHIGRPSLLRSRGPRVSPWDVPTPAMTLPRLSVNSPGWTVRRDNPTGDRRGSSRRRPLVPRLRSCLSTGSTSWRLVAYRGVRARHRRSRPHDRRPTGRGVAIDPVEDAARPVRDVSRSRRQRVRPGAGTSKRGTTSRAWTPAAHNGTNAAPAKRARTATPQPGGSAANRPDPPQRRMRRALAAPAKLPLRIKPPAPSPGAGA